MHRNILEHPKKEYPIEEINYKIENIYIYLSKIRSILRYTYIKVSKLYTYFTTLIFLSRKMTISTIFFYFNNGQH